jgi:hypothetical protein
MNPFTLTATIFDNLLIVARDEEFDVSEDCGIGSIGMCVTPEHMLLRKRQVGSKTGASGSVFPITDLKFLRRLGIQG